MSDKIKNSCFYLYTKSFSVFQSKELTLFFPAESIHIFHLRIEYKMIFSEINIL